MRIEEQNTGRYNKYPDRIDAQLIRILNRYFNDVSKKDSNLVDAIVDEVMVKIKEQLGISKYEAMAIPEVIDNEDKIGLSVKESVLLVEKDLLINPGDYIEYVIGKEQRISVVEIITEHRKYYHSYTSTTVNIDETSVFVEMYEDRKTDQRILYFKNTGESDAAFKIKVFKQ